MCVCVCVVILYLQLAHKTSKKLRKHTRSFLCCFSHWVVLPPPLPLTSVFGMLLGRGWHQKEDGQVTLMESLSQLPFYGQAWNQLIISQITINCASILWPSSPCLNLPLQVCGKHRDSSKWSLISVARIMMDLGSRDRNGNDCSSPLIGAFVSASPPHLVSKRSHKSHHVRCLLKTLLELPLHMA